jgi:hypothetical protein
MLGNSWVTFMQPYATLYLFDPYPTNPFFPFREALLDEV